MNFYNKYILPKLLHYEMQKKEMELCRPDVVTKASGAVLEIGFGSGLNLPFYKNVAKLYALDPSRELFKIARERVEKAPFLVEHLPVSAEKIPLADNSVDFVVSTWTLCSIPHVEEALKEIRRVLKPSGKYLFIEHGKSPKIFAAKMQKFLTPASEKVAGGCRLNREIDKLISAAGFKFEKLEKFQQGNKFLDFIYKGAATVAK